ncbi:MAG: hypothetical protein KCHDKBKB_00905 [Elusimicrobia bacterium]|nr:hypothetical protein [Elusimicrobiota bacterium]
MEIFCRLLFGHLLADFTFQTNFIADWKRRRFTGLLFHVFLHPVFYLALTWPYLGETWRVYGPVALNGWVCVALITLVHFIEDWFRVLAISRGANDNTFFYFWDQFVHLVAMWFLAPVNGYPLVNDWPILGILFVVVTHCATVTIWFIEKDIYGKEFPETEEKYISILQRLVVWLSFFLPHPWWIFILLFVLISFFRHVWTRRVDFSWASVIMGNSIAVICGIFSRFVLNFHF